MKRFLLLLAYFASILISANNENLVLSYKFFENKITQLRDNPSEQIQYIRKMINKAKQEDDLKMLHRAYSCASTYSRGKDQIKYGDSLLMTAYKQNDSDIIGDCYLAKGSISMNEEKYTDALKNFIIGYNFIKKKNNPYLVHNAEYLIAQTKIYLGQYQEANEILNSVVVFFRKNHYKAGGTDYALYYLYSLISYIDTNSRLGQFQQNEKLIREGIEFINQHNYHNYLSYFISLEGTDAFFKQQYDVAIEKLNEALRLFDDNWKHLTETYYLGMSYWEKGDKNKAIEYFLKIDKEYKETGRLDPHFRPAIEMLFNYYKEQNNIQKQLEYINELIYLDKVYERDYKELFTKLTKIYSTEELNKAQDKLKIALDNSNNVRVLLMLTFLLLCMISWFAYRYYLKQKYYKLLYAKINSINRLDINNIQKPAQIDTGLFILDDEMSEINPSIIENIQTYLENFENEKRYLDRYVSLKTMSMECGTNKSYLSKIINHYKKEHFISYLNSLRLNSIVEEWKVNPKSRRKPIQEIAEKAGFSSAQSFSRNFKEKYGISPTYFLKHFDKKQELKAS